MSKFESVANTNIDWDDIQRKYKEYLSVPYVPDLPWVNNGHIEDPSQSKAWNEEFVHKKQTAYKKARTALKKKRANLLNECAEMIKSLIWRELDSKLSDADIERYYERWYERYHDDGFDYMCSMMQAEIAEIKEMDWFKDRPDYNYV